MFFLLFIKDRNRHSLFQHNKNFFHKTYSNVTKLTHNFEQPEWECCENVLMR